MRFDDEARLFAARPSDVAQTLKMTPPDVASHFERMSQGATIYWGVDNYFLIRKTQEETDASLKREGFEGENLDYIYGQVGELGVRGLLYDYVKADKDGQIVIPSRRLVLAHTVEDVRVPKTEVYRMRDFFEHVKTREILPFTTNVSAPNIQPGSSGPQTYEIYNISPRDITVKVSDLSCPVDILPVTGVVENGKGPLKHGRQTRGEIKVGGPYIEFRSRSF